MLHLTPLTVWGLIGQVRGDGAHLNIGMGNNLDMDCLPRGANHA